MPDALHLVGHLPHLLLLAGGSAGVLVLVLAPHAARAGLLPAPSATRRAYADPVEVRLATRIEALHRSAVGGTLVLDARRGPAAVAAAPAGLVPGTAADLSGPAARTTVAVVAAAGAAAVHAVAAGAHFAADPVTAVLLGTVAVLQLLWALALAGRGAVPPGPGELLAGLLLHGAALGAWVVSRTVGLPGWLHGHAEGHGPGAVDAWGAAAAVWQLTALAVCVVLLRAGGTVPRPAWGGRGTRAWAVGSALGLVALALTGVPS